MGKTLDGGRHSESGTSMDGSSNPALENAQRANQDRVLSRHYRPDAWLSPKLGKI